MLFCGMGYLEMDSTINGVSVGYSTHTDDSYTLAYLSNYEAHPRQELLAVGGSRVTYRYELFAFWRFLLYPLCCIFCLNLSCQYVSIIFCPPQQADQERKHYWGNKHTHNPYPFAPFPHLDLRQLNHSTIVISVC